jgi:hypothetical protein
MKLSPNKRLESPNLTLAKKLQFEKVTVKSMFVVSTDTRITATYIHVAGTTNTSYNIDFQQNTE